MRLADATRSMNAALEDLGSIARPSSTLVFLSYATPDRAWAAEYQHWLKSIGYECWWDQRIGAGGQIDEAIVRALDDAFAAIVLWSDRSVRRPWVRWEASRAKKQGKLIPVAHPGLDLDDIMPPFHALNTLKAGDDAALIEALQALHAKGGA